MRNWLVAAALILILSLVLQLGLLTYAMYALLAIIFVSRQLTSWWADSLEATRECNRLTAETGETVAVIVTIENRGRLPIPWVLIEDMLPKEALLLRPPSLSVEGKRALLAWFPPAAKKRILFQVKCNRRGYYQLGPLALETGDPLGLHRRYKIVTAPHYLLVMPQIVPLIGYEIASRRPIGEVRMTHRLFEDPTRNAGVRRYEAGDPLNRVHWKATARTGVLHSRVFEPSSVAGATLMLDFHRDAYADSEEPVRSETAITAAASLANAVYEMGQQVGLITNGRDAADRIRSEGWDVEWKTRVAARQAAEMQTTSDRLRPQILPTRRGPDAFLLILEALARLEKTDGLQLPELIAECEGRIPRDASLVVILARVREQDAIALGSLRRQGYAITAVVNVFETSDLADRAGHLISQGIRVLHLRNPESIASLCREFVLS